MAGREVDPEKVATYALAISQGATVSQAILQSGISRVTVYRQLDDPGSKINQALAKLGLAAGKIPTGKELSKHAARALEDFGFFRSFFFGRSTSPWAEDAAQKVVELLETPRKEYLVVNIAPGTGKSTFFTHDLPAWILCRDRAKSIMIGSLSQNMANAYVNQLRVTFERAVPELADPDLVEMGMAQEPVSTLALSYGRFKPQGGLGQWSRNQFDIAQPNGQPRGKKEPSVAGYGMESGFLGGRFDFAIWDDVVDDESIATEKAQNDLIRKWKTLAETRINPNGLLILQGQRLSPNDLYRYCLNLKEATEIDGDRPDQAAPKKYHHIVYKAHDEEKCMAKEFPETHALDAKPWPEGCLLDPYRLAWRELANMKLNDENTFRTVFQQEDIGQGDKLVKKIWIEGGLDPETQTYFPGCYDDDRSSGFVSPALKGVSIITADPSPTQYWSVIWWVYNPENKFNHLIEMKREPMTASDFLDYNPDSGQFTGLLETWWQESFSQNRPITTLIVEENAAQRFMLQYNHFKKWSSLRRVNLVGHQTGRNKSDPKFGVQALSSIYKFGQVRLPGNKLDGSRHSVSQLVKEVTEWPGGVTDDCVMSHWFLVWNAQNLFPSANLEPIVFPGMPSWAKGEF